MKGLTRLRNLIFGYEVATNPDKGLEFLEFLVYFFLISIIIVACVYIIKGIKYFMKKETFINEKFDKKEAYRREKELSQVRAEAEANEGKVSIYKRPNKSKKNP